MDHIAVRILNDNRTMAISTVRPDGWPQVTIVGYVNDGFDVLFSIFRESQKFANIAHDDRIAIAVAPVEDDFRNIRAVYAGGHAQEITGDDERQAAWKKMMERHPVLAGSQIPGFEQATFMRMHCKYVSVLDYSQGLGHREEFVVEDDGSITTVPSNP